MLHLNSGYLHFGGPLELKDELGQDQAHLCHGELLKSRHGISHAIDVVEKVRGLHTTQNQSVSENLKHGSHTGRTLKDALKNMLKVTLKWKLRGRSQFENFRLPQEVH